MKFKTGLEGLPYKQYMYGFTFYIIIAIVLSIIKFSKLIDIPMLWVLAPIWIPLGITIVAVVIIVPVNFIIYRFEQAKEARLG